MIMNKRFNVTNTDFLLVVDSFINSDVIIVYKMSNPKMSS